MAAGYGPRVRLDEAFAALEDPAKLSEWDDMKVCLRDGSGWREYKHSIEDTPATSGHLLGAREVPEKID